MKIYSAQLKGTTTVATGSNVSLTGSFSGSINTTPSKLLAFSGGSSYFKMIEIFFQKKKINKSFIMN